MPQGVFRGEALRRVQDQEVVYKISSILANAKAMGCLPAITCLHNGAGHVDITSPLKGHLSGQQHVDNDSQAPHVAGAA
eukprot:Skav233826  [mRNA]  locus=scaffold100:74454:77522:- [translate_table: standard]